MKLNPEGLQERLLAVVGNEELAKALYETATKLAPEFEGESSEFVKAVYATVKDTGLKVADGAIYNQMAKILTESIVANSGGDKPKPPPATTSPKKIRVALKPSIAAYGGQFYDPGEKVWIKGTEEKPQVVAATLFVKQKLATGELIEVD